MSPYTRKLLLLRDLQAAGYPIAANDLAVDEWLDLGRVRRELEGPQQVILVKPKGQ